MDQKDERTAGIFLLYKSRDEQVAEAENGPKATLFFEFLADLSPHLAFEELVETFEEVLSTTTIQKEVRCALLPLWLYGHTEGSSKYMRAAFAPLLDEEITFRWPWFDDNRAAFLASGFFPETWQSFASVATDKRLGLRAERVTLLLATVSATIMRRKDAQQYSPGSYDRWGWDFHNTCDIACKNAERQRASVIMGDWRTYPPFFPGDETTIRRKFRHST